MKGSLYSVSDKAMFDAINQSKVTNSELKDIFLSRGIIVSHETKREKLARYFSLFPHSYQDYKRLADILGANTRREKNTSTTVNRIVDKDIIETVAAGLVSDLEHFGATCTIEESEMNSISIKVEYREFNYSNSEFKQISNKEAVISIEINEENLIIRHPQNKTVEEWKSLYISKLESELEEEVETTNINLSNTTDHEVVTRFFNELINGIDGYKLYDVTDVYVYHPEEKHLDEDEDEDEDENDFENLELGTHISKASLKGQNVLRSEELLQLYKKGFYISKIVWRSKSEKLDDELYEFEAQFSDAENKDYFSYLVKGFYSYKGSGEYVKGRKSLTSIQERELTKKVETAAHNSLKKVME